MSILYHNQIFLHGWLQEAAQKDLSGFIGQLDEIVPDIIKDDDIYGKDRLTRDVQSKDVGSISNQAEWNVQFLWWNSESQSNWLDGLFRHAYILQNNTYIEKAKSYLNHVLAHQDDDGYIGIYGTDLRYDFNDENGELWAQSSFFRVALGYYEYTKDETILSKIERAMHVTMNAYNNHKKSPFNLEKDFAGVCHGLTITDSLYVLYKHTNKKEYLDYALYLYEDYDKYDHSEPDILTKNLLNPNISFSGHGVHTYEHLRSLLIANLASNGTYQDALQMYLTKLHFTITPSGGPIGDEWVAHRSAHPTRTGYEFCSIHELLSSYGYLIEINKDISFADPLEWLYYNANFGARHPHESAIAYCKTDNSFQMMGDGEQEGVGCDRRYKYSVAHQDAAVCCVPNAGRILPYFVENMILQDKNHITLALYGPVTHHKTIDNHNVTITQHTNYPFELSIKLSIETTYDKEIELELRIPSWADSIEVNGTLYKGRSVLLTQKFTRDTLDIIFHTKVKEQNDLQGRVYYTYGPLLYSYPLEAKEFLGRTYKEGMTDKLYNSIDIPSIRATDQTLETLTYTETTNPSFANPPCLIGVFNVSDEYKQTTLLPIGSTILRQVTFDKE